MRRKLGGAVRRAWAKSGDAAAWAAHNHGKAMTAFGAAVFAACMISVLASAEPAYAKDIVQTISEALAGPVFGIALDAASGDIAEALANAVRLVVASTQTFVANTASGTLLTNTFDTLLGDRAIYDALYHMHHVAVIPLANIVAAIFLVIGLVKIIGKAGQTEGGIEVWQFMWLFICYGLAKTFIDVSWEVMYVLFNLSNDFIASLLNTSSMTLQVADPTEGIQEWGALLALLVMTIIGFLITAVVCGLANLVVIVRAIQIYLYTVFSPIPIAFSVSEGGRQMTEGFFKRYVALLLSGALLAVLFTIFSMMIGTMSLPAPTDNTIGGMALYVCNYILNIFVYGAFGYAIFKSGAWARDLVGV